MGVAFWTIKCVCAQTGLNSLGEPNLTKNTRRRNGRLFTGRRQEQRPQHIGERQQGVHLQSVVERQSERLTDDVLLCAEDFVLADVLLHGKGEHLADALLRVQRIPLAD